MNFPLPALLMRELSPVSLLEHDVEQGRLMSTLRTKTDGKVIPGTYERCAQRVRNDDYSRSGMSESGLKPGSRMHSSLSSGV